MYRSSHHLTAKKRLRSITLPVITALQLSDEEPRVVGIDDIVLDDIVARVVLDVDFTAPIALSVIVVECVVDKDTVIGIAAMRIVAAKRDAHLGIVIDKVVADGNVTGILARMFAGNFHAEIGVVNDVAFDNDICRAVHVDTICTAFVSIGWIAIGTDVIDGIANDRSVASAVNSRVRVFAFITDEVNADVVVIVNDVVRDRELFHIGIQHQRFAPAELAVVDFVAINDKVMDGCIWIAPIDRNAMCAATLTTVLDIMHFVVADFDERAIAAD